MVKSILCLDIGSGTQDVLYWQEDLVLENCPKFVLPAPARRVMARLRELTAAGQAVYLHGTNMGGGFYRAAMAHVKAGLPLAAHPDAAYSLADDLGQLEKLGVAVREERPAGHVPVPLADYDPGFWQALLGAAGLPMPELVLACAQDHGFHPGSSNRIGRFNLWRQFLIEAAGRPAWLLFRKPPPELTRLAALQRAIGGGPVADTGAAAVLGALYDPGVARTAADEGVCLVNAGNSHVIAFLLYAGRMYGVYEHHTGLRSAEELWRDLTLFRRGELTMEAVFDSQGHGCLTLPLPAAAKGFVPTFVIGPQRRLFEGRAVSFPAPGGDMMLAGALGLLKAWQDRQSGDNKLE